MCFVCVYGFLTVSSKNLSVTQIPLNITVNEGESTQISCCWNEIIQNVKVAWYINEKKEKQDLQENKTQNCSILNLTNILKNASGHYVCEVTQDIPVLLQKNGSGTVITVNYILVETTTTVSVHTLFNPAAGSSREVVIIYIFRSLPFICLLVVFFYLNRDKKQVTASRPESQESGEKMDEDLEAGETQRSETEVAKQGENVSEQEKRRVNNQKPEVTTAATEEEKENEETDVVVDTEQGTSPMRDDEKNKTESVLNTDEKTLMTDAEEVTVSVLGGFVSAL
ncbi:uncharacterized protein LOC109047227 isoform X1 [Cyprinus carpio]|uniref:Uncharacterized protein LOC109047227 isoform X1 n=1 Tax=Cyprinus carpio TaxID=7962 RepID=A0A9Q9ZAQ2_CYPCA|nr:uncharacterized protein LOC109047227 isoform X1 [Cyprinus carpio]